MKKQLAAIDAGTFPRLPDQVPRDEVCQDWRLTKSPNTLSTTFDAKCNAFKSICKGAAECFDEDDHCDRTTGDFFDESKALGCTGTTKFACGECFPKSVCGTSTAKLARILVVVMLLVAALRLE